MCPFRLVTMLRGGEDCTLVTLPPLAAQPAPSALPLPPIKMRPEAVAAHTVSWEKLRAENERERNVEAERMMSAMEASGFCFVTVTPDESAKVTKAMQAARHYFAQVLRNTTVDYLL